MQGFLTMLTKVNKSQVESWSHDVNCKQLRVFHCEVMNLLKCSFQFFLRSSMFTEFLRRKKRDCKYNWITLAIPHYTLCCSLSHSVLLLQGAGKSVNRQHCVRLSHRHRLSDPLPSASSTAASVTTAASQRRFLSFSNHCIYKHTPKSPSALIPCTTSAFQFSGH